MLLHGHRKADTPPMIATTLGRTHEPNNNPPRENAELSDRYEPSPATSKGDDARQQMRQWKPITYLGCT